MRLVRDGAPSGDEPRRQAVGPLHRHHCLCLNASPSPPSPPSRWLVFVPRREARVAHMPSRSGVFADCAAGGGGHEGGGGGLSPFSLLQPKNNATSSACSALRRIGGLAFWVSGWARHLFPAGSALLRGRKPFAAAFRQSERVSSFSTRPFKPQPFELRSHE